MALTRSFRDTIKARAATDPAFKQALLTESLNALPEGGAATGSSVLRDDITRPWDSRRLAKPLERRPKA